MNIKKIIIEEMDDFKWIKDVKSNQDIAQDIADDTKIDYNNYKVYSPFVLLQGTPPAISILNFLPLPKIRGRLNKQPYLVYHFLKYCKNNYGLTFEYAEDVWNRYREIMENKLQSRIPRLSRIKTYQKVNESDDMQWIKDITPIKIGDCLRGQFRKPLGHRGHADDYTYLVIDIKSFNQVKVPEIHLKVIPNAYHNATIIKPLEKVLNSIENGYMVVCDCLEDCHENINESDEDDFDMEWVDDVRAPKVGDIYHNQVNLLNMVITNITPHLQPGTQKHYLFVLHYKLLGRMFKSYPERTIYLDDFLTASNNNRWIKINKEISSGTENIDVLYLNESDDMDWIRNTESTFKPNFEFSNKEQWIDISDLHNFERKKIVDYIERTLPKHRDFIGNGLAQVETGTFEGIIIHCGTEHVDYEPEENIICFSEKSYKEDYSQSSKFEVIPHIYIDGREILEYINSKEEINESDDMEWIEDTNDPWENIDQELINKLTDYERHLIEAAFEDDQREHGYYGCNPIYKITSMEFDDEEDRDEWDLFISFEVTCEEGSNKGINYITLYINRDTGGWYMA